MINYQHQEGAVKNQQRKRIQMANANGTINQDIDAESLVDDIEFMEDIASVPAVSPEAFDVADVDVTDLPDAFELDGEDILVEEIVLTDEEVWETFPWDSWADDEADGRFMARHG